MYKVVKSLDTVLCSIAALALLAMMILTVVNALTRTWFSSPIEDANEIVAQWFLPVLVLFGIPAAQVWKEHLNVTLATERMNPISLALTKVVGYTACAVASAALTWFGLEEALKKMDIGATAGITTLPVWPFYFLVPIGFAFATIVFVLDAVLAFRRPVHDLNTGTGKPLVHTEEDTVL